MAFTRKWLKAMGIDEDVVEQIMSEHVAVTDALKGQRDDLKARADEADELKKKLDEAVAAAETDDFRSKYEEEHEAFEKYKSDIAAKDAERDKRSLYRSILEKAGIDAKRIDSVLRVADLSKVTVKDGQIEDADKIEEAVKEEWADFIVNKSVEGANVSHPPASTGGEAAPTSLADAMRQKFDKKG